MYPVNQVFLETNRGPLICKSGESQSAVLHGLPMRYTSELRCSQENERVSQFFVLMSHRMDFIYATLNRDKASFNASFADEKYKPNTNPDSGSGPGSVAICNRVAFIFVIVCFLASACVLCSKNPPVLLTNRILLLVFIIRVSGKRFLVIFL